MGKTNQLGVLADVFTSDASNNVGIGGSPSGSYKLEVTGTAKVSTSAYFAIASGSVGIGTISPAALLHLSSSVAGTSNLFCIANTNASGTGSKLTFVPNANFGFSDNAATISSLTSAGGYNVSLTFGTYKSAVGPSESMRIDGANGYVGLGVTTPVQRLDVLGNGNFGGVSTPYIDIKSSDTTGVGWQYKQISFKDATNAELYAIGYVYPNLKFDVAGATRMILTSTGQLQLNNGTALRFNNTVGTPVDTLQMFTDGNVYLDAKDNTGGNLIFRNTTTLNERMRITSAGKFFFNTTTDNGGGNFQVKSPSGSNAIVGQVSDNTNAGLVGFSASSGYTFYVLGSGQIYSTSTSITLISSDYNLKTDIKDYDKGLAEVLAMKPRYFKYKDNLEEEKIGFIAQEMEEVIAGSMINSPMGNHKTYQLEWYPLLVKAIQELNQQNQDLKSRLDKAGL